MQPDGDLATALTVAVTRLARDISAGQSPDLSVSEMSVLAQLEDSAGPLSPSGLAAAGSMTAPSMTRHLKTMRSRGLVELAPHPGDKRRVQVSVTGKGRELLAQARQVAWLTVRVAELPGEHRDVLHTALPILDELSR